MSPRTRAEDPTSNDVLRVGELTRRLGRAVESLGRVSVEGEVSRLVRASSGHLYLDLKDSEAKLACKIWRSQVARAVRGELREGDRVIARGKLDVYGPQGSYSLIVDSIQASGLGELLVRLEELKADLRARGWFDRSRPLPRLPRMVGVVTSRDGAALQDILRTRSVRWPSFPLRLCHAPVQGPGAAARIAEAIGRLDASGVDVILVCRGGGSIEDLWAFNELPVAEAIQRSSVPVVSGVGHETDVTLADLVADVRAHTPTDAAQRALPERARLVDGLVAAAAHMGQALDLHLQRRAERLERLARARVLLDPRWMESDRRAALERAGNRLGRAMGQRLERAGARGLELSRRLERHSPARRLDACAARLERAAASLAPSVAGLLHARGERLERAHLQLEALSPLSILRRGYSITTRADSGEPLVDASQATPGEVLETRFASGRVRSRVEDVDPAAAEEGGAGPAG